MNNNIKRKDWVGGSAAVFKTLGASNHTDADRQREDYYATEPKATEWLCKLERFEGRILEPSCGEGHMSRVLEAAGYEVVSRDLVDRGYGEVADFSRNRQYGMGRQHRYQSSIQICAAVCGEGSEHHPRRKEGGDVPEADFPRRQGSTRSLPFYPTHSCLGKLITTEMRYEWRLRQVRQQRCGLRLVRVGERI